MLFSSCCGNSICHSLGSGNPVFFTLDPCSPLSRGQVYPCESRGRGDTVGFCFPQQILFTYTETTEYLLQYLLIDVSACGGFDAGNGLVSGPQHHCGNLIIAGS